MLDGWKQYFMDLAQAPQETSVDLHSHETGHHEDKEYLSSLPALVITSDELDEAISSLKKEKASGLDEITPEHIQNLGETARRLLLLIVNVFLTNAHTPLSLKSRIVIPIHKGKGKSIKDPKNYRGITITSSLCKLLELVLKPHLELSLHLSDIPDEFPFGFRKQHSCILTLLCLALIIELNSINIQPTFVALLDAEKAFDKV
nr:uncharacterized protein LOC129267161 [Lytechinus pictus]